MPGDLTTIIPRACDCDFCIENEVNYISDIDGKLIIKSRKELKSVTHGSKQAEFLCCPKCGDVIAAVFKFEEVYRGVVNGTLLDDFNKMQMPQAVSPQKLSAEDKLARWNEIWMPVEIKSD